MLLVGNDRDWPPELKAVLGCDGYIADLVAELSLVPSLLADGKVRAVFVSAGPLGASDVLVLRRVREASPRTAIVVVTKTPTDPDLKRAFESGATAFLSWPASADALRHAIESGAARFGRIPRPPVRPSVGDDRADAPRGRDSRVTLHDRLPPDHPQRPALENAIRDALAGLAGSWDVVVEAPSGPALVIAVVAPDGSAWTMSCCKPEHRDPESIADTVRAACNRRRWRGPSKAASGSATGGAGRPDTPDAAKNEAPPVSPLVQRSGGNRT